MSPLDPPPAPLAPGGNVSPSAPVAPLAPGQGVSPSVPPAPLAAGQAVSPSAPPAPLVKGGNADGADQIIVTGTLTEDGTTPLPTPITLFYAGEFGGKPSYTSTGESIAEIQGNLDGQYALYYDSTLLGEWFFARAISPSQPNLWVTVDDADLPQDATGWTASGFATGTPVLTLNRGGPAAPPQPFPAGQSSSPVTAPASPLTPGQAVTPSVPPAPLPSGGGVSGPDLIVVTGALTDGANPITTPITLLRAGEYNGRPFYSEGGYTPDEITESGLNIYITLYELEGWFFIKTRESDFGWESQDDVSAPQEVPEWAAFGTATGALAMAFNAGAPSSPPAPLPAGQTETPASPPQPV